MALNAQEPQAAPAVEQPPVFPSTPVNLWQQGTVTLTTSGSTTLAELVELLKEQLGQLNWIMQGDVGDIQLPAFSVKDASVESLMMLLGTAAGFDVQSAPPQAVNQREIVMIRRSNAPVTPQASTPKEPRLLPTGAILPEPGKRTKAIPDSPDLESVPLPSKHAGKTLKVMSLGAFSDEDSWNRNTRGLSQLLTSVLSQGGKEKGLPDDALTFNSDSRLLIIRLEPEKAAEAVQLVEGYVASLKERQGAVDEQLKELLKKKVTAQMALKAATFSGKGENHPEIDQLKLQLDSLSKAIAEIEVQHGLR
jgi:hypothetical protein